jgi:phosphate transport system substrate-binding protein
MAQKSDTLIGVLVLAVTLGIFGSAGWFLYKHFTLGANSVANPGTNPIASAPSDNSGSSSGGTSAGGSAIMASAGQASGATFASITQVPPGNFRYGGSTTWATIRGQVDRLLPIVHPDFNLTYATPATGSASSSSGVAMLLDGTIDFAQIARPLSPKELDSAKQKGITLRQIAVAIDGIAVAVNPSLTVPGLTLDQLRQIYLGTSTNWSQVGGPNLPIVPLLRAGSGSIDVLLGSQQPSPSVIAAKTTTEALRKVSSTPGALYFTSAPEVVPQCTVKTLPIGPTPTQFIAAAQLPPIDPATCPKQRNKVNIAAMKDGTYPLTRGLYVIIKQDNSPAQKAGEAYANLLLSNQGQELMSKADFVRVR